MFRPFAPIACCRWLLVLSWLVPGAAAQTRPSVPWRVIHRTVRQLSDDSNWPGVSQDTSTHLVRVITIQPVAWDVSPDSIRLFRNCQNQLTAPALPHAGHSAVRFEAAGATVALVTEPEGRWLAIVPSGPTVTLRAYRGRRLIFRHSFIAIPPPLPTLHCFCSSEPTYTRTGRAVTAWSVKVLSEAVFANALPNDARYGVFQTRLTLVRNGVPVAPPLMFDKDRLDPSSLRPLARPGDELHVEVRSVKRLNFRGNVEVVPLERLFVIPVP